MEQRPDAQPTYRTDWTDLTGIPAWDGSGMAAYRIWKRCVHGVWQQRHEWKRVSGEREMQGWIPSIQETPSTGFEMVAG